MENDFDALLGELDVLSKALPPDDTTNADGTQKIVDAAADGAAQSTGEGEGGEGGGEGDVMGKSLRVTLADGTEVDALDGTAMVKALSEDVSGFSGTLMKSLQLQTKVLAAQNSKLVEQGKLIKSLQGEVARMGNTGRGRATQLSVHEKPTAGGPAAPTPAQNRQAGAELMAKALSSVGKEGGMTAIDVSRMESYLNRGEAIPANLLQAAARLS